MIKKREFPEHNYRGIWFNGKTIRIAIDPSKPIIELKWPEFWDVKITDRCQGKCSWCAHPDTLIGTKKGKKKISEIKTNDVLFTYDEENNKIETQIVETVLSRKYDGNLIVIELENNQKIKITPKHKIYTKNKGWIEAGNLNEEDDLLII